MVSYAACAPAEVQAFGACVVAVAVLAGSAAAALAYDSADEVMAMEQQSRTRRRIARAARMEGYRRFAHEQKAHAERVKAALRTQHRRRQVDWVVRAGAVEPVYQADPLLPEAEAERRAVATLEAFLSAWSEALTRPVEALPPLAVLEELAGCQAREATEAPPPREG